MEIVLSRKNMNKCENLALQNGVTLEKTIRDSAKGVFDSYAFKSRVAWAVVADPLKKSRIISHSSELYSIIFFIKETGFGYENTGNHISSFNSLVAAWFI